MTGARTSAAIRILWWTVGLVILLEGSRTFYQAMTRLHRSGHGTALAWVRMLLSGSEILAVPLFLVPATAAVGGYALLVIIAMALSMHALHGNFWGLDILVLYGIAVYASLVWREDIVLQSRLKQRS
jgi:hypothetical protein